MARQAVVLDWHFDHLEFLVHVGDGAIRVDHEGGSVLAQLLLISPSTNNRLGYRLCHCCRRFLLIEVSGLRGGRSQVVNIVGGPPTMYGV